MRTRLVERYYRSEWLQGSGVPLVAVRVCPRAKPHFRPLSMVQIFERFRRICERIAWGVA